MSYFLIASSKPSWHRLYKHIAEFMCYNFDRLLKGSAMMRRLSAQQMKTLLSSELLNVRYEEEVYDAVMDWVVVDTANRRKEMYQLFQETTTTCALTLPSLFLCRCRF